MLTQPMVQKKKCIYDESIIYLSQISFHVNKKHYETVAMSPWLQLYAFTVVTINIIKVTTL